MFLRTKTVRGHTYLQVVENRWEGGRTRQRVLASLGRLDELQESGRLDRLLESAARFSESLLVVSAHRRGKLPVIRSRRIGPPLLFERLWREVGCREVLQSPARRRFFHFSLERAVFATVLHRLFDPGSDRAAEKWKQPYRIEGAEGLQPHHFYRAMGWLGEELPRSRQEGRTPFAPRCRKDVIEERLFAHRRHLFSGLDLVFFDTTSLYFEGRGGESLGRHGNSKDHRPDLPQMVVGVVLDGEGVPLCSEMWPGNTADVKSLIPVAERLERRFGVKSVCVVADRGMIGREVIGELERRNQRYILGARMRSVREVDREVLSRAGRYREVRPARTRAKAPAPLKVKEVWVEDRRYDGKWVLRTNARELEAGEVALRYKQLWLVEDAIRSVKSILQTRPIYHKRDETIRGHVFCSFLALVLRTELERRLEAQGRKLEWAEVVRDLDRMEEIEVRREGKHFLLRTEVSGVASQVFQASGVALPPTVRTVETVEKET